MIKITNITSLYQLLYRGDKLSESCEAQINYRLKEDIIWIGSGLKDFDIEKYSKLEEDEFYKIKRLAAFRNPNTGERLELSMNKLQFHTPLQNYRLLRPLMESEGTVKLIKESLERKSPITETKEFEELLRLYRKFEVNSLATATIDELDFISKFEELNIHKLYGSKRKGVMFRYFMQDENFKKVAEKILNYKEETVKQTSTLDIRNYINKYKLDQNFIIYEKDIEILKKKLSNNTNNRIPVKLRKMMSEVDIDKISKEGAIVCDKESLDDEIERLKGNLAYDLTFTVPKSVSILLLNKEIHDDVVKLTRKALLETLEYYEDETSYAVTYRRNKVTGEMESIRKSTNGNIGFLNTHKCSRPVTDNDVGAPQLHFHVNEFNIAKLVESVEKNGETKETSTFYSIACRGSNLHQIKKVLETSFLARMRYYLSKKLGISWYYNPKNKEWEVKGVKQELIDIFSERSSQINKNIGEFMRGEDGGVISENIIDVARKYTKKKKNPLADDDEAFYILNRHKIQRALKCTENDVDELLEISTGGVTETLKYDSELRREDIDFLTEKNGRFNEAHALGLLMTKIPFNKDTYDFLSQARERLEELKQKYGVVPLETPREEKRNKPVLWNNNYMTTLAILNQEDWLRKISKYNNENPNILTASSKQIEDSISDMERQMGYSYAESQKKIIRGITSSKEKLNLINGSPGSGKTEIIRGLIDIYQRTHKPDNIVLLTKTREAVKNIKSHIDSFNLKHKVHIFNCDKVYTPDRYFDVTKKDEEQDLKKVIGFKTEGSINTYRGILGAAPIVIVDEYTTLELYNIIKTIKDAHQDAKIIFIGDNDQVHAVSEKQGSEILYKYLDEKSTYEIRENFRQKDETKELNLKFRAAKDNAHREIRKCYKKINAIKESEKTDKVRLQIEKKTKEVKATIKRNTDQIFTEKQIEKTVHDELIDEEILTQNEIEEFQKRKRDNETRIEELKERKKKIYEEATEKIFSVLNEYYKLGMLKFLTTDSKIEDYKEGVAEEMVANYKENRDNPDEFKDKICVISQTNAERDSISELVRAKLSERGYTGKAVEYKVRDKSGRAYKSLFAEGDRIEVRKNTYNEANYENMSNRDTGIIIKIDPVSKNIHMLVDPDPNKKDRRKIVIKREKIESEYIKQGGASTIYSVLGHTKKHVRVIIEDSSLVDGNTFYVSITRHKEDISIGVYCTQLKYINKTTYKYLPDDMKRSFSMDDFMMRISGQYLKFDDDEDNMKLMTEVAKEIMKRRNRERLKELNRKRKKINEELNKIKVDKTKLKEMILRDLDALENYIKGEI